MRRPRAAGHTPRAEEQAASASRLKAIVRAIGVSLFVTIGVAYYAITQRNIATDAQQQAEQKEEEALHERQIALFRLARYFSAESKRSLKSQPQLSVLLAVEALSAALVPASDQALRQSIQGPPSTPLVDDESSVWSVAFSPDGTTLASGSADKTIRLWSLSEPRAEPRVLRGHESSVRSVAFSPDGTTLASGSVDKTIRLWSLSEPGVEPRVLRGHESSVRSVAFSPDGTTLASGSVDKTIRLWSLSEPGVEPRVLRGHESSVRSVAFSPDGTTLASGSYDKTIRLWSLSEPGAEPRVLRGHESSVWSVAFSIAR